MEDKKQYGLFTAMAMVVGVVIGSGIFFKSDNVLAATGGSVALGAAAFVLGALGIVFGGLCMGELAAHTREGGGFIAYAENFVGRRFACSAGWFQLFVYYPTITAVVSWVVGVYACQLFGWRDDPWVQAGIGAGFLTLCVLWNSLSARLGGLFQNGTALLKLIPLGVIAVCGWLFGDPAAGLAHPVSTDLPAASFLAALGPIAFSYDGWIVSASVSHEVRRARRNMPLALGIAPLIVLLVYVLYFVGITGLIGPDRVMELGDAHVYTAAEQLLGAGGAKILLIIVILSVMGTVNGLVMGAVRLPATLAERGMLPGKFFGKRRGAALLSLAVCLFWSLIHTLAARFGWLPGGDVSEAAIALSYLLYAVLYLRVIRLYREGKVHGRFRGLAAPVLAVGGALLILSGGVQMPRFPLFAGVCLLVVAAGFGYAQRRNG